jgi:copper(I)-binding protein
MLKTLLAAVAAALIAAPALASDAKVGDLTITHAFARASAGPAKAGAAYLTVKNGGAADDRLVAVKSSVAARTGLHSHINEGGVMKMRPVEGGIPVPAGGVATLAPGGYHVMMMGLAAPLVEGETFQLELTFEKAGTVTVDVKVAGVAAGGHKGHKTN